jgi:UDP-N-acetylmuramate dehydrogenase
MQTRLALAFWKRWGRLARLDDSAGFDMMERIMEPSRSSANGALNEQAETTLIELYGDQLKKNVSMQRFTAARVGGPADYFLEASSAEQLATIVTQLWSMDFPFKIVGGGSNLLVSDDGVRGIVVLNRAHPGKGVRFEVKHHPPIVWAESGVNLGQLARRAVHIGLGGLEWAIGIPGTLGGAVVGNAGAHGGDIAGNLVVAEILQRNQSLQSGLPNRVLWQVEEMEYAYRNSRIKVQPGNAVVLKAQLHLERGDPVRLQAKLDELIASRRQKQPSGASLGSMFKNPSGDYAGRLIEAAGLKGARVGDAEISTLHANFFINKGKATADDILELILQAQNQVALKFGVRLELEIELLGKFGQIDLHVRRSQ